MGKWIGTSDGTPTVTLADEARRLPDGRRRRQIDRVREHLGEIASAELDALLLERDVSCERIHEVLIGRGCDISLSSIYAERKRARRVAR
jgi:hypothetical protein